MTSEMGKSLTVANILTIIPITDFVGANWFYLGRTKMGGAKLALFSAMVILLPFIEVALLFLLLLTIWWLIDITLVTSRKIKFR